MTADATDEPADGATQRPELEPGLLRRARPDGYWGRAFRRRPWATSAMVLAPLSVVVGVPLVAEPWVGVHLTGGAVIVGWFVFSRLRDGVRATADAADEAEGVDPGRSPVDVRADAAVRPAFGPGTVTGGQVRDLTVAALVLLGGPGALTLVVAVVRRPLDLDLVGIGGAFVGAALTAVVLARVPLRRRTAALLDRTLEPVPVRVVGLRTDGLSWVVEPVDGGARSDLVLHSGDDLLVAGDVVHAWGDAVPQIGATPRRRRLALTGPFGTLWVARVLDERTVEIRDRTGSAGAASDAPSPDGVVEVVVPGAGRLPDVRRADGTVVRARRTSSPR
ncbi:MAG: hypothetical protein HY830_17770 [Actinobacteria bacterium]|nr:hypothetical protein [Actinomycetota bacterium]